MDQLLKVVGDARVVTVSDVEQLTPIGAGGWLQDNLSRHGSVELTVVRRHKDPRDRDDFELVRSGRAPDALANMADRGRVHISKDRAHRVADVLADYVEHRQAGWRAQDIRIIADTSNADIDTANRFIQRDRLFRGEIREKRFEVHSTEEDRRWSLHEGDQVIFLRAYKIKGEEPVRNGSTGVVMSLNDQTGRMRVRIDQDDGTRRNVTVRLQEHEHRQPVGLAYAIHANKCQGAEVPIALVMPGMGQTTRNSAYSMLTRVTHEAHVYLDHETHGPTPIDVMGKAWQEPDEKRSAMSRLAEVRAEEQNWQKHRFGIDWSSLRTPRSDREVFGKQKEDSAQRRLAAQIDEVQADQSRKVNNPDLDKSPDPEGARNVIARDARNRIEELLREKRTLEIADRSLARDDGGIER